MGKIRTVKPELFRHEELFEAEKKCQLPLRLIFIGLFTAVDREGRFRWKPKQLKLDIMPYDDIDFEAVMNALAETGFIQKYEKEGQFYGHIPTWCKHQSINKHEPLSRLPDPVTCNVMPISALHKMNCASKYTLLEQNFSAQLCTCMHMQSPYVSMQETNQTMQPLFQAMQSPQVNMPASLEMEVEEEKEKEKEMEEKTLSKSENKNKGNKTTQKVILHVFEHWKQVMGHPNAILDDQRQGHIKNAIEIGYSVEALCTAIDGCRLTPHNMGQNDRGEQFNGLHVIFKSADQIDRFIKNAQNPPRPLNKSEQRIHDNLNASQTWLKQHLQEDYHL